MFEFFDWYVYIFARENLELLDWTSILTAGAVVIAPLSYVIKRWHTNKTERKTISKSLCTELQNVMHVLDGTIKRQVMEVDVKDKKMYYTLAGMHYDMYDSLIFSGKIQLLDDVMQQKLQDVFRMIKKRQEYLHHILLLRDQSKIHNADIDEIADPYYEPLANHESKIGQLIPKIMKEIKGNF